MKKILTLALLSLAAVSSSQAASITKADVVKGDDGNYQLSLAVDYGGGCKDHKFKVELGMCLETAPVRCQAKLIDLTDNDFCEALVSTTVLVPFADAHLNDKYYAGGSLTITGDSASKATVTLPSDL